MNEARRIGIISKIDLLICVFLFIIGILVFILWQGMFDSIIMSFQIYLSFSLMMSVGGSMPTPSFDVPLWLSAINWIGILLAVTTIIYSIKRLVDNILKIIVVKNQKIIQPPMGNQPIVQQNNRNL